MNFLWVFFSGLYLALLRHQANLTTCQSLNTLYESEKCCSVMSDSLWPYGLQPTRLLCPWASPGKNTGAGCHALLQRIFLIQESNLSFLRLLHQQAGSLSLAPPGKSLYSCTSHLCSGNSILAVSLLKSNNAKPNSKCHYLQKIFPLHLRLFP